jgi:hypothetical protein
MVTRSRNAGKVGVAESELIPWMRKILERDPRLHGLSLESLPPGPGGRNHLFAATSVRRSYVIKVRRDANDTAEREAWALRRLKGTIAPRLISWWPGDVTGEPSIQSGGGLVMAHVPGEAPSGAHLKLASRIIAQLHSHTPRRGPELLCPSSPAALLRYSADLTGRLVRRRKLSPLESAALTKALRRLGRRDVPQFPSVRTLCHGDLRWHNMRCVNTELKLIDFELAGIGDPALDLALMVARTPLSDQEAAELLSAYSKNRPDETLRARYAFLLPLVSLVSALSAVLVSARGAHEELARALARSKRSVLV